MPLIRRLLGRLPAPLGDRLSRYGAFHFLSTHAALGRAARRGVKVATVLDVGASDGRWSLDIRPHFPDARYHLIEANRHHAPALERLCAAKPGFSHALAAAGDAVGEIHFNADDPFGGVGTRHKGASTITVPMTTLDHEAGRLDLPGPYLVKLDTHGFEVPILAGASAVLARTSVAVIEVYLLRIQPDSLRFHELCAHMEGLGFLPADLSEPLWRPRDGALWQFDLVFLRKDAAVFADNGYG